VFGDINACVSHDLFDEVATVGGRTDLQREASMM
jgi:hypothetical protein